MSCEGKGISSTKTKAFSRLRDLFIWVKSTNFPKQQQQHLLIMRSTRVTSEEREPLTVAADFKTTRAQPVNNSLPRSENNV
jgi:hypothetical protein